MRFLITVRLYLLRKPLPSRCFSHFCITEEAILVDRCLFSMMFLGVSTAANHMHFLHKTKHLGPSGTLWLRWPILQIFSNCFKSFTNPLQNRSFWSLGRLMARDGDPRDPFQLLQILYKSFKKRSILGPQVPQGSGGQSGRCCPNASNPEKILYKTDHSGASGASWLGMAMRQILFQIRRILYKSFTKRSILEFQVLHGSRGRSGRRSAH